MENIFCCIRCRRKEINKEESVVITTSDIYWPGLEMMRDLQVDPVTYYRNICDGNQLEKNKDDCRIPEPTGNYNTEDIIPDRPATLRSTASMAHSMATLSRRSTCLRLKAVPCPLPPVLNETCNVTGCILPPEVERTFSTPIQSYREPVTPSFDLSKVHFNSRSYSESPAMFLEGGKRTGSVESVVTHIRNKSTGKSCTPNIQRQAPPPHTPDIDCHKLAPPQPILIPDPMMMDQSDADSSVGSTLGLISRSSSVTELSLDSRRITPHIQRLKPGCRNLLTPTFGKPLPRSPSLSIQGDRGLLSLEVSRLARCRAASAAVNWNKLP